MPPAASRTSSHVPPLLLHLRRMHLGVQEAIMSSSDKCSRFPTTPAADGIGGSWPPLHLPHTFQLLPSLHLITRTIRRSPTGGTLFFEMIQLFGKSPTNHNKHGKNSPTADSFSGMIELLCDTSDTSDTSDTYLLTNILPHIIHNPRT
ncbi:hypothetical protein FB451DRAFT_1374695 [Mycena latifolia]|nr:hypothetical protein FB451DRAFT_1374695 [Mycena latifolia]